jgi:SAM-dependent methyltransferase
MPLTAAFVPAERRGQAEPRFPLEIGFCPVCTLVQVLETVPPEAVFHADYPYYSSYAETMLAHARRVASELIEERGLGPRSLVVELASNDGYLLVNFVERGIPVLGVDPAPGPAAVARRRGVDTRCAFFSDAMAEHLRDHGSAADVVIAMNVLAHVADTNGFVHGIHTLLKDDGVAVIEVPYVRHLIERSEFDTIYHEHLCYFSVTSLDQLFRRHGLFLNDLRHLTIHGGSLRLYVGLHENVKPSVTSALAAESETGITRFDYYAKFAERVADIKRTLESDIRGLYNEGKRIAAYGAAAKGVILLNSLGIDNSVIEFVADRNVHKVGSYMPGLGIPVVPTDRLLSSMPDYVLLLAWNFADEILKQQIEYRNRGGRFIIPLPAARVV